jgi:hypothetical protein
MPVQHDLYMYTRASWQEDDSVETSLLPSLQRNGTIRQREEEKDKSLERQTRMGSNRSLFGLAHPAQR